MVRSSCEACPLSSGSGTDRMSCSRLFVQHSSVRPDDLGVELAARLDRTLLSRVVHVHDSKAPGISVPPLKIVEERPHVVSLNGGALLHRLRDGVQISAETVNA